MKKFILLFLLFVTLSAFAQHKPFRFAFLSDTHIGSPNGSAEEDLRRTVRDINAMDDIAFVVITGDITELGTNSELATAKRIFDSLDVPYYIIPGNHDTGWSESGGMMYTTVFGYDKFSFNYEGIQFMGCPSGPYVRMSDGHVPRNAVNWLDSELNKLAPGQPVIFLNHYPMDPGLDNWYEITDRLRKKNTWAILCGHGHANKAMSFEDIPGVMGRSNLRAKASIGGYNLVDVSRDSIIFSERRPGVETLTPWTGVKLLNHNYEINKKFNRPDFSINDKYSFIKASWTVSSDANIISTPAVFGDNVIVGNQSGKVVCLSLKGGNEKWSFLADGPIFSSPAIAKESVVFGSCDGYIYCLKMNGKLKWKTKTKAAVLGSPLAGDDFILIGGSDGIFRMLDLATGAVKWNFSGLEGPVVSTPVRYEDKIIFGAWDRHLYAVGASDGKLIWKWNNGSTVRNYSPASCIPVASNGVIYIVAPDRYITAIDAEKGTTLWRNNDATVRESIGMSADSKWIYGKTMQDTIVAYAASREKQSAAWKMHVGFGYEHVPSMLIEKNGIVYFGTKSGVVYAIDPLTKTVRWAHKIDNSMVNTVNVIGTDRVVASTMDGKIVLLERTR
jgi:outer membrane protein assembly factor BamB/predicted phosphodiesterase